MELVIVARGLDGVSEHETRYKVKSQRKAHQIVRNIVAGRRLEIYGDIARAYTLDGWQVRWSRNYGA